MRVGKGSFEDFEGFMSFRYKFGFGMGGSDVGSFKPH